MKSLYLRIYATVVVVLLLFALVSGWVLERHLDDERVRSEQVVNERLGAWAELLGNSLPDANTAADVQVAALRDWSQRLRVPLALDDLKGERIGASESFERRMLEGVRARPASTHPAISYVDETGRRALGFRDAHLDATGYRGFEDIFRGDEQDLRQAQERYVTMFAESDWVLDLGCGRGELLDGLRDAGIRGKGVDLDPTMVERCREKGHDVELADAATALRGYEDGTIPAVFAAQVVEHLSAEQLTEPGRPTLRLRP